MRFFGQTLKGIPPSGDIGGRIDCLNLRSGFKRMFNKWMFSNDLC